MIQVNVRTNTVRKSVNKEISATPASVLDEMGLSASGAQINLGGTILSATDLNSTFEALGITDNTSVNLNSIVKADGGAL